jgi:Tfp pilus assembly protein PilX
MRPDRQKGFVLFVVIILMTVLGLVLAILASHLKNLAYETTTERLKVYNSSSMAWANHNAKQLAKKTAGQTIDLDVSELSINGGRAAITVTAIEGDKIKINLTAECSRGRVKLKRTRNATLKIPPKNQANL